MQLFFFFLPLFLFLLIFNKLPILLLLNSFLFHLYFSLNFSPLKLFLSFLLLLLFLQFPQSFFSPSMLMFEFLAAFLELFIGHCLFLLRCQDFRRLNNNLMLLIWVRFCIWVDLLNLRVYWFFLALFLVDFWTNFQIEIWLIRVFFDSFKPIFIFYFPFEAIQKPS